MESILTSIKKLLGVTEEMEQFDPDIIMSINSVLLALTQMGVGPENGFMIHDKSTTWKEFLGEDVRLEAVKTWVYLKVKLIFDPPTSSVLKEAINENLKELEWRIGIVIDY